MKKSPNWKWLIALVIKILVFVALFWSIYSEATQQTDLTHLWSDFLKNFTFHPALWALAVFLMPLNWGIEAIKWQLLIRPLENCSFTHCFKAICSGVTLSMFTPNRTGDFGGRVLLLQPQNRWAGVAITLVGSLAQLLAALFIGMLGAFYVAHYYFHFTNLQLLIGIVLGGIIWTIGLWLYYHLVFVKKISFLKKWHAYINPAIHYSIKDLTKTLWFSACRQLVFSFQFYILLKITGISTTLFESFPLILSIFFSQTFVPSIALIELGVRGKIAVFFMNQIGANEIAVLSASFLLWGINLLVPALLGAFFIAQVKIFK